MQILFIHQNFPGQFKHLAPALVKAGHSVTALAMKNAGPDRWQGVTLVNYRATKSSTPNIHPWLVDFESKLIRGDACYRAALSLKASGYNPDVIVAHPGWGESLFIKEVWPNARLGIYCEYFYGAVGGDTGFDPEFSAKVEDDACRLRLKNLSNTLHFETADAAICPTHWQASTFPAVIRERITVLHDGIDTDLLRPSSTARLAVNTSSGQRIILGCGDEVITFVSRNLEPHRGFHVFMRALPELLKRRPNARILVVGGEDGGYGGRPKDASSWKMRFTQEVRGQISDADWSRLHFVGKLPYDHFVSLLQLSSVHIYWTYPFVLSWSLLEAMSVGCSVVASNTAPVQEVIHHGKTGQLVDFFDIAGLVDQVCGLLDNPEVRRRLGQQAREWVVKHYDLKRHCLPGQLEWVRALETGSISRERDYG